MDMFIPECFDRSTEELQPVVEEEVTIESKGLSLISGVPAMYNVTIGDYEPMAITDVLDYLVKAGYSGLMTTNPISQDDALQSSLQ